MVFEGVAPAMSGPGGGFCRPTIYRRFSAPFYNLWWKKYFCAAPLAPALL